jgi:serine/threonine-protein kinase ULK2
MAAAPQSPAIQTSKRMEDDELRPYVIVGDLGKGSFATVYKGYNEVRHHPIRPPYLTIYINNVFSFPLLP